MKSYAEARAAAQAATDADGMDRGIERMPGYGPGQEYWHVFLLPERHNRCGHELRCEVVMCWDLKKCPPGHGPEAPPHVPVEERIEIARAHGRLLDSLGVGERKITHR